MQLQFATNICFLPRETFRRVELTLAVQRKFREADEEESYFNEDDSETEAATGAAPGPTQLEQKLPTVAPDHEVTSLLGDVESLDQ